jgi:hypothetical protein
MSAEKSQALAKDQFTPLEYFDAHSAALIGFQANANPNRLRETINPLVDTIATIRDLLASVNIVDLRNIVNPNHEENVSRQIGTIINTSKIEETTKEALRQLVTSFFIRITAVLSTPTPTKRGRPLGSKTKAPRATTPQPDHSPSQQKELIQQLKGQYIEAMTKTLETYNATTEEKIDLKQAHSTAQLPPKLAKMLAYIPFMLMARTQDNLGPEDKKIPVETTKSLMDSTIHRQAAVRALRELSGFSAGSANSFFAWVTASFREKREAKLGNTTRWEHAIMTIGDVELSFAENQPGTKIEALLEA